MENILFISAVVLFVLAIIFIIYDMFAGKTMRSWLLKKLPLAMKIMLEGEGISIEEKDLNTLENFISDGVFTQREKQTFLSIISKYLDSDKYEEKKEEILSLLDSTLSLVSDQKLDEKTISYLKTLAISFLNVFFKRIK